MVSAATTGATTCMLVDTIADVVVVAVAFAEPDVVGSAADVTVCSSCC